MTADLTILKCPCHPRSHTQTGVERPVDKDIRHSEGRTRAHLSLNYTRSGRRPKHRFAPSRERDDLTPDPEVLIQALGQPSNHTPGPARGAPQTDTEDTLRDDFELTFSPNKRRKMTTTRHPKQDFSGPDLRTIPNPSPGDHNTGT